MYKQCGQLKKKKLYVLLLKTFAREMNPDVDRTRTVQSLSDCCPRNEVVLRWWRSQNISPPRCVSICLVLNVTERQPLLSPSAVNDSKYYCNTFSGLSWVALCRQLSVCKSLSLWKGLFGTAVDREYSPNSKSDWKFWEENCDFLFQTREVPTDDLTIFRLAKMKLANLGNTTCASWWKMFTTFERMWKPCKWLDHLQRLVSFLPRSKRFKVRSITL